MNLKIGIFDSGIGGFTILNSLLKSRNDVEVFYLADTKRNPYGNKTFQEIRCIAEEICTFFRDKNLDALLVACNTTNACALDILEKNLRIPCFDLINSVSEIVTQQTIGVLATQTTVRSSYYKNALNFKKKNLKIFQQECPEFVSEIVNKQIIGVLATRTTVQSSYYKKAISSKKENLKIFQQECPDFVSEIEKEKLNLDKLDHLAELYLRPILNKNIEELILGCSHYPLIYDFLRKKIDSNIKIIDPSEALIKKFNEAFTIPKTDRYESISFENVNFFVTSERDQFSKKVKYWLGINKEIRVVNLRSNV